MSALKSDDYVKHIERFLDRHRIDGYRFERRSKHRAVVVASRQDHDGHLSPLG